MTTKPFDTTFASRRETFAGRFLLENFSDLAFCPYNKAWVARRKAVHSMLKIYGGGGKTLERVVIRELRAVVEMIRHYQQATFDPTEVVYDVVADIIGELVNMVRIVMIIVQHIIHFHLIYLNRAYHYQVTHQHISNIHYPQAHKQMYVC
jgi:hypothetical protein